MKILNRILVIVLALLVVAAPVVPQNTAQAATARATTIRLEKTQGKVGLKSQSGSNMSISAGMRLTAGNTVSTGGASYSWESLDGSKAIKEDQNSVITLKQKGSTNEILVKKGAVAFNVKVPLKKNEKMNIRTSTMVAGVRGTIGVVEVVSDSESILYLLEGKIALKSVNHVTGEVKTVTVRAGEKAVVKRMDAEYKENARVVEVQKSKLDEEEVPVFARTYVKNSKSMQNRISATGKVSVPILIGTKTPCKSILADGTVLEAATLNSSKDEASLKKQVENLVEEKIAAQAKIEEVLALTVEEILGTKTGGGEEPPVTPPYVPPTPTYTYTWNSGPDASALYALENNKDYTVTKIGNGNYYRFTAQNLDFIDTEYVIEGRSAGDPDVNNEVLVEGAAYPVDELSLGGVEYKTINNNSSIVLANDVVDMTLYTDAAATEKLLGYEYYDGSNYHLIRDDTTNPNLTGTVLNSNSGISLMADNKYVMYHYPSVVAVGNVYLVTNAAGTMFDAYTLENKTGTSGRIIAFQTDSAWMYSDGRGIVEGTNIDWEPDYPDYQFVAGGKYYYHIAKDTGHDLYEGTVLDVVDGNTFVGYVTDRGTVITAEGNEVSLVADGLYFCTIGDNVYKIEATSTGGTLSGSVTKVDAQPVAKMDLPEDHVYEYYHFRNVDTYYQGVVKITYGDKVEYVATDGFGNAIDSIGADSYSIAVVNNGSGFTIAKVM